ncbi:MAG TPA: M48 family metallopeptidase [Myxococcota bacterium]|mgnify:CR=1 FL=1|nr:M48 family metallopeptidase [Myxococcota bacterium]HPB51121.1 M48 family metallopeptidase [Myxococcota bacterium]HQP96074.1 M48 family metallopeptidase [Myxococcota bacterium]
MDFFAQQDMARKKSGRLVVLFILAVVFIILAVYVAALALSFFIGPPGDVKAPEQIVWQWWRPNIFFTVTFVVILAVGSAALMKLAALRKGGAFIAQSLGGVEVSSTSRDPDERRLMNVVEEVAIASGVPVPSVFILPGEAGINAFAAGWSPSDAAVAVTAGAMKQLTRDELQGVVAHEFGHVLNGDMRLNLKLVAMISGIMVLATIGYWALHVRPSRNSKNGNGYAVILLAGLALLVIGYGGAFVGRIIQSAVSRQREYLADASAVQFTRNPAGLANALKRIAGYPVGSVMRAPAAREMRHMFFGASDVVSFFGSMFATHPPLNQRIKQLDPSFDGDVSRPSVAEGDAGTAGVAGFAGQSGYPALTGAQAVSGIGALTFEHVQAGSALISMIPPRIRDEIEDPLGACAVVSAMMLDKDPSTRQRQMEAISTQFSEALARQTDLLAADVAGLDRQLLLPIVDLSLPAMRRMSPVQYVSYSKTVASLARADNRVTLFEFCLQKVVEYRLFEAFEKPSVGVNALSNRRFLSDAAAMLSAVARAGNETDDAAVAAYEAGIKVLFGGRLPSGFPSIGNPGLERLDAAFNSLSTAPMRMRRQVMLAVSDCIVSDRHVTLAEAEMLRAIAYCLGLPLPPYLQAVAS